MSEPSLAGRRLLLRPLVESDAPALFDAVAASRPLLRRRFRWVGGVGAAEHVSEFIRAAAAAAQAGSAVVLGAFEAKGQKLLGVVALDPIMAAAQRAQLSLWVRADEQDKGFAAEAGRLAVDYAFRKAGLHRLSARIDPSNRAARKILQRLGFRYEGCLRQDKRLNGRWVDQECWGQLKKEWKPATGARTRK